MKYRKKPVVIDAIRYEFPGTVAMAKFLEGCRWRQDTDGIAILTLEGEMKALPNDWIIKGIKGEFYPCKPDIFATTYDEVAE